MSHTRRGVAFAVAVAVSACGMSTVPDRPARCEVAHGERLPAASGGATLLCAAVDQALAGRDDVRAVRVVVGERLLLTVHVALADGRALAPLRMAQSDQPIGPAAFNRLGKAIADHVAGSSSAH